MMQISTKPETPDEFTKRVSALLRSAATHVYVDTSFLVWLTTIGTTARSQFVNWTKTIEGRVHVPLWSMHEYYRHHTKRTLKSRLDRRADALMSMAKAFQLELKAYSDQCFFVGQPEASYQDAIDNALEQLAEVTNSAKGWDYESHASDVIEWMNAHACDRSAVFKSMALLEARGSARFTQDLPPGFWDRHKKEKRRRGSNRYGDLLFWEEAVAHANELKAASVVIITRDRKDDWYYNSLGAPEVELDWKRLKSKWLPVPLPHPTLAFELKLEAGADLVLIDELYLGAVLWKFGRPQFERFAAVAIDVTPDRFMDLDQPVRPVSRRAANRNEASNIGVLRAAKLVDAALGAVDRAVDAILANLELDAPSVEAFIEQMGIKTLDPLSLEQIAVLCRALHDKAKIGTGPAQTAATKLLALLDELSADIAAAAYLGFLCSAYFSEQAPLSRPQSHLLDDILEWQVDPAFKRVLQAFHRRLLKVHSAALYYPSAERQDLRLVFEHAAEQPQDPVVLKQVYFDGKGLLVEGQVQPEFQLRTLLGSSTATIKQITRVACRHFGIPFGQVALEGAHGDDLRQIPEWIGLREFDRFTTDDAGPASEMLNDDLVDASQTEDDSDMEGED